MGHVTRTCTYHWQGGHAQKTHTAPHLKSLGLHTPWSCICVTWLIHTWDMTHSCVWHDSHRISSKEPWFANFVMMYLCEITYLYLRHDSFTCVIWCMHLCDMPSTPSSEPRCACSMIMQLCDMTYSYVWHDSFICVTRLFHMCDMTHSYVWHDSFICVTWLIRIDTLWSCNCVTWLIHTCDMTHSDVCHDSFIYSMIMQLSDMTHSYVWHDSFICVTWLIHMCDKTHSYMWQDSFIYVTWHRWQEARTSTCIYACVCVCTYTHACLYIFTWHTCWGEYRVAKTHRIPYLYRSFSAKEPYI